jgi:hypothetical protein
MTEYEIDANGNRVSTRFAPGYFQMMADFIRYGRIKDHYGNAEIVGSRASGAENQYLGPEAFRSGDYRQYGNVP